MSNILIRIGLLTVTYELFYSLILNPFKINYKTITKLSGICFGH